MIMPVDNFLAYFFNNDKIVVREVILMSIGEKNPYGFPFKIFLAVMAIFKGNQGRGSTPA